MAVGVVLLALVNIFGGLMFGYNSGVVSGAQNQINGYKEGHEWVLSTTMQGLLISCILIGALVGSMIGGPLADSYGRKMAIIVLAIISLVLAPVLAIMPTISTIIVARTFLGLGVGMAGVVCPMYVSENSPPTKKGILGIMFQLAICTGILLAYVANTAFEYDKYSWRIMFAIGAIPAAFLLIVGFVIPESLVWQANQTGGNGERSSLMRGTNEPERTLNERISIFLRSRALFIGVVLAMAQQLTGINAFMFYAQTIFSEAGFTKQNIPTIGLGAWNVATSVIAIPFVYFLGRRPLLIFGTFAMSLACAALAATWKLTDGTTRGYIAVVLLLLFVLAFEISAGPLFWMVAHELFTPEIKTVGASTLNAVQWIFNIILSFTFPIAKDQFGLWVVLVFFAAVGTVCTFLMALYLPETRPNTRPNSDLTK